MDMESIKDVSELITDESMIQFKNGKTIKGAVEVSTIIMKCCEEYNEGYLEGYLEGRNTSIIAFGGAMILGGTIGIVSVISASKIVKKLKSRKEASK